MSLYRYMQQLALERERDTLISTLNSMRRKYSIELHMCKSVDDCKELVNEILEELRQIEGDL